MRRIWVILILLVFGVSMFIATGGLTRACDSAETKPALKPPKAWEFRGICLQLRLHGASDYPFEKKIDEIVRTGANTLCLVLHGYQKNVSATEITIDPKCTPDNKRLVEIIRYARKQKLKVIVLPIVLLKHREGEDWRGLIKPPNWDAWWKSYRKFILDYARISQQCGVEVFSVGSELVSTEKQLVQWTELIGAVRKVFHGHLTYSANWDHYKPPQFWNLLDIVGITTYFEVATDKDSSMKQLLSSWAKIKKDILEWQKKIERPIMFTEVGWPNQITAARYPWNYYASPDKPDPELQSRCFEAFFDTWNNESAVAGFLVWEWPNRDMKKQQLDPDKDTSYYPCEKPAMKIIEKQFDKKFVETKRPK